MRFPGSSTRLMSIVQSCGIGLLAGAMLAAGGCRSAATPMAKPKAERPAPEFRVSNAAHSQLAVMNFSRGLGGFPIVVDDKPPQSVEQLVAAMTAGYDQRLAPARPDRGEPTDPVVVAEGPRVDRLTNLSIHLSGRRVRGDYTPSELDTPARRIATLFTDHLEYTAAPLVYETGRTTIKLRAEDAELALLRDHKGVESLVLRDAREGEFELAVAQSDLRNLLKDAARTRKTGGYRINDLNLNLAMADPQTIDLTARVDGIWAFIPASLSTNLRVKIVGDNQLRLESLNTNGNDLAGMLVAGVIEGRLRKWVGHTIPLARWSDERIVLRDVRVSIDEYVRIKARFGR
jgi:hypothetical protein